MLESDSSTRRTVYAPSHHRIAVLLAGFLLCFIALSQLPLPPSLASRAAAPTRTTPHAHNTRHVIPSASNAPHQCVVPDALPKLRPPTYDMPTFLKRYVHQHARRRRCYLANAPAYCSGVPPALVWSCPPGNMCAGLGDRVTRLMGVFLMAVLTDRMFFIEWPNERASQFDLLIALVPAQLDWRPVPALYKTKGVSRARTYWFLNQTDWHHVSVPHGDAHVVSDLLSPKLFDLKTEPGVWLLDSRMPKEMMPKLSKNPMLAERFQEYEAFTHDANYERILFHMHFAPSRAVEQATRPWGFDNGASYVGLHIRTGHDILPLLSKTQKRFAWAWANGDATHLLKKVFNCMVDVLGHEPNRMFVASDSLAVKQASLVLGRKKGVAVRTILRRASNISLKANQSQSVEERCEIFLDIFVDLVMLARADSIVSTGSTFARAAYFLGDDAVLYNQVMVDSKCTRPWWVHRKYLKFCR